MEWFAAILAVMVGWLLGQLAVTLYVGRERASQVRADKRHLYARFLAAGEACYRAVDDVVKWEELAGGKRRGGGVQDLARLTADIAEHLRSSRMLFAEMRLLAPAEVLRAADDYHRTAEEGALLVRFAGEVHQMNERWRLLGQQWESARDAFQAAARDDLGEHMRRTPRVFARRGVG